MKQMYRLVPIVFLAGILVLSGCIAPQNSTTISPTPDDTPTTVLTRIPAPEPEGGYVIPKPPFPPEDTQ